jgi:hypothetical protein
MAVTVNETLNLSTGQRNFLSMGHLTAFGLGSYSLGTH